MVEELEHSHWDASRKMCLNTVNTVIEKGDQGRKSRIMGSRRIFSPQFKIQVLDSYRQDVDCRGNQRATARKYNIHRRQIQKWLQCEQQLRTAVADKHAVVGNSMFETRVDVNKFSTETRTLKLAAQKLYPRSVQGEPNIISPTPSQHHQDIQSYTFNLFHSTEARLTISPDRDVATDLAMNKLTSERNISVPKQFNFSHENVESHTVQTSARTECEGKEICHTVTESHSLATSVQNSTCLSYSPQNNELSTRPAPISPKRKWMQESLQESQQEPVSKICKLEEKNTVILPAKQRVKLMRIKGEDGEEIVKKSCDFSIERLCAQSPPKSAPASPQSDYSCSTPYQGIFPSSNHYITVPIPHPYLYHPHSLPPELISLRFPPPLSASGEINNCVMDFNKNVVDIKEEKWSESEDEDVDVTSTTPVEDKHFDFTRTASKRRSFSVQFKLQVLEAFHHDEECNRNQRATARKFNINRRQVQKWLSQESELRSESSTTDKFHVRQRREDENNDCSRLSLECRVDAPLCCYPPSDLQVRLYPYHALCDWRPGFDLIRPAPHFPIPASFPATV